MITLQYFDGKKWIDCGSFVSDSIAWMSLGGDDIGYRTVDENGKIITDKSVKKKGRP